MRKAAATLLGVLVLIALVGPAQAADQSVKVYLDGRLQTFNPAAIVHAGKAYVPLRQTATVLSAGVNYDAASRTITMVYCDKTIKLKQSEGLTVSGTMFVPLRKVSEAFGCKVSFDAKAAAVHLSRPASTSSG